MVPMPYLNIALNTTAVTFSPNVRWSSNPALNASHLLPLTMGDEAGVGGGLKSGSIKGKAETVAGSPIVFVNSAPAKHLLNPVTGNAGNAMGVCSIPSVSRVLITDRAQPRGALDLSALRRATTEAAITARRLGGGTALLTIPRFVAHTSTRAFNALSRLDGIERLVIDLRGCPGGRLDDALALADDFVPRGTPLVRIEDAEGDARLERARQDEPYPWPLAILVDSGTASAAEVFAGALSACGRAVLLGSPTFGKGSAQAVVASPDGRPLLATVARITLPTGRSLDGCPLEPARAIPPAFAPALRGIL
jgi:carboxyl-terminal processing protease